MNPKVYLAGPIKGLNYNDAVEWREKAKNLLADVGLDGMSPMRAKSYLKDLHDVGQGAIDSQPGMYESFPLSTNKGILSRDFNDCSKSNAVIMYLKGAKAVSIGSVMEVAWSHAARVPLVLVMEKAGNVHEHGLMTEACSFRVETIEEAIHVVKAILLP